MKFIPTKGLEQQGTLEKANQRLDGESTPFPFGSGDRRCKF
jgi:hypothetical protein